MQFQTGTKGGQMSTRTVQNSGFHVTYVQNETRKSASPTSNGNCLKIITKYPNIRPHSTRHAPRVASTQWPLTRQRSATRPVCSQLFCGCKSCQSKSRVHRETRLGFLCATEQFFLDSNHNHWLNLTPWKLSLLSLLISWFRFYLNTVSNPQETCTWNNTPQTNAYI